MADTAILVHVEMLYVSPLFYVLRVRYEAFIVIKIDESHFLVLCHVFWAIKRQHGQNRLGRLGWWRMGNGKDNKVKSRIYKNAHEYYISRPSIALSADDAKLLISVTWWLLYSLVDIGWRVGDWECTTFTFSRWFQWLALQQTSTNSDVKCNCKLILTCKTSWINLTHETYMCIR